jgi:hypothetical protein
MFADLVVYTLGALLYVTVDHYGHEPIRPLAIARSSVPIAARSIVYAASIILGYLLWAAWHASRGV